MSIWLSISGLYLIYFGSRKRLVKGLFDVRKKNKLFFLHFNQQEVKSNPHNYDAWFDYLRLVENDGDVDTVREVYERAIANVPPSRVCMKQQQ